MFSVIGKCLSIADQDDSTVVISLNARYDGECQTPGVYYGSLTINFDRISNDRSIINFNYALVCNTSFELVGSDVTDHDYILGGPEILINLGTWIPKSNCGGLVQSNLRKKNQTDEDWFKFDKISQ
jgi:hypothetical protein